MLLPVLNAAAYRFVPVVDPAGLREHLFASAEQAGLKGTLLIAGEGINLCLAGADAALRDWLVQLQSDARFADLDVKTSTSASVPFKRLLVKVKREIIRMDHPLVRPHDGRAASVDAPTLARWLDAGVDDGGRPVVLLDTRNGFEVDAGRFRGAIDWRLTRFGAFPQALHDHAGELAGKTVVSYCTGGIRCEKAALLMNQQDGPNQPGRVLQLDGGILRYLEQVGSRHFDGHCFVFDARETLDATLAPTPLGHESTAPRSGVSTYKSTPATATATASAPD